MILAARLPYKMQYKYLKQRLYRLPEAIGKYYIWNEW